MTSITGKHAMAHRAVYEYRTGQKIPYGYYLCHKCDVPSCVNPNHMFIGTARENTDDMLMKNRQAKGRKINFAKLTPEIVRKIRAENGSYASIAKTHALNPGTIRLIKLGITWKHVS